ARERRGEQGGGRLQEAPKAQAWPTCAPGNATGRDNRNHSRLSPRSSRWEIRMTDATGDWEVVGRLYTTAGGKNAHVRVQRVEKPGVTEVRMWGAYEKISVQRVSAEGKR